MLRELTVTEEYFAWENLILIFLAILPVLFLLVSALIWYKFGRNEKADETVECYPPDCLNSAEIGFYLKGKSKNKDIISLLMYLADNGYLKIREEEIINGDKTYLSFTIIKLKDYDGSNEVEKMFFNDLFQKPIVPILSSYMSRYPDKALPDEFLTELTQVSESQLQKKFYVTLKKIRLSLLSEKNKYKIFDESASKKGKWVTFFQIITAIIMIFAYISDSSMISVLAVNLICFLGMIPLRVGIIKKRTPYGIKILGRIKGFKSFLETAQKEKLEELILQNPEYLYIILPYAYVLGVSDIWINKIEDIAAKYPLWYDTSYEFDAYTAGFAMNNLMKNAVMSMSSSPRNTGSGYWIGSNTNR